MKTGYKSPNIWLSAFVLLVSATLGQSTLAATTYMGLVQGLAGEDYYQRQFDDQFEQFSEAIGKLPGDIQLSSFTGDQATKEQISVWLAEVAEEASSEDRVGLFYIGHGTWDDRNYKFNLPGPDLAGVELLEAFEQVNAEFKLLVNTGSSSGALMEVFEAQDDLVLITATKSGRERNATRFGRFFIEALSEDSADLDKNQRISAKEAYDYAERATADFYSSEGLIATEHSQLIGESGNVFTLSVLQQMADIATNPVLQSLYIQRDEIDLEIERLRMRRVGMSDQDYRGEFQQLMVELSLLQLQIDQEENAE